MSAEDRLREILQSAASGPSPTGNGLDRIRERLARRRRTRLLLVPGAALVTTGVVVAVLVLGGTPQSTTLEQTPLATPTPAPTAGPEPTGGPSGAPTPRPAPTTEVGPALWPFTSDEEVATFQQGPEALAWAEDPVEVTRRYVADVLGFTTAQPSPAQDRPDGTVSVELLVGDQLVGTAALRQLGRDGDDVRPWTVTGIACCDLTITTPRPGTPVSSPLSVSGRITGVDENVSLSLVSRAGSVLATTGVPAGSAAPWQAALPWKDLGWTHAGVVARTFSAKDGSLNRLVVVPVTRATGASASGAAFAGVVDGHVSLLDASTGNVVRQLTYPPAGSRDSEPSWSSGSLAWVRQGSGCGAALLRLDQGVASTVIRRDSLELRSPQLSPSGGLLAWVQRPCGGTGTDDVVVRGGGGPDRVLRGPTGTSVGLLDVREDGALLLHLNDRAGTDAGVVGLLPAGATSLAGLRALAPDPDCYPLPAAAFDGPVPVMWEGCLGGSRQLRYDDLATVTARDPLVAMLGPDRVSFRDGRALLQLSSRDGIGAVARYRDGAVTILVSNAGCASGSERKGCVRHPDW